MNKLTINIMIGILIIISFKFIDTSKAEDNITIYVDDNYNKTTQGWNIDHFSNLSDAINATRSGDSIFVYNGIYHENIVFKKSIVFIGEDRNNTIIDGCGFGNTINIIGDNVSISNFTIRNSGVEKNNSGIFTSSDNNIFYENILVNNSVAIILYDCKNNKIENNFAEKNIYGIGLHNCYEENYIHNNNVYNNNITGIYLSLCSNNSVYNNSIKNNSYGISISYSEKNHIYNNDITNNIHDGLNLFFCNNTDFNSNILGYSEYGITSVYSNNNRINNNYITNNSVCGIRLILGSCENEVINNTIANCDVGIYITNISIENNIYNNLFSSNNKKLVDHSKIIVKNSASGFMIIILIISILFIFFSKRVMKKNENK